MSTIGVIHYNWPGYDLEGFARRASEIGYKSCELQIGDIWDEANDDGGRRAEAVRDMLAGYGIAVSAVAAGNDFIQAQRSNFDAQIARYRRVCEIIPHTGTDIIRSDGGWNRGGLVTEDLWDGLMLEAFQRCAEFLETLNVRIALDNHGVSTNDGDWQLSLIERVGSTRLGVNLDTMNYRWFGHDLAKIDHFYEIIAPHTFHTHMKDAFDIAAHRGTAQRLQGGRPRRRRNPSAQGACVPAPGRLRRCLHGRIRRAGNGRRDRLRKMSPLAGGSRRLIETRT